MESQFFHPRQFLYRLLFAGHTAITFVTGKLGKKWYVKKKGEEESTCTLVEKLKKNYRSCEHNSSYTRHLSSHTPLMFCDFTNKLREWSNLIEPGQSCLCHHQLLCSHSARSVKLQMRLVKPHAVGTRFKAYMNKISSFQPSIKILIRFCSLLFFLCPLATQCCCKYTFSNWQF